jgi:hypothetical protein
MRFDVMKAKNFFVLFISILASLFLLESLFRIYNPFPVRIKGNNIVFLINQKYIIENDDNPKIDNKIIHTKNSLGFRGPDIPDNFSKYLSIIIVGGSTSECYYLSDNNDWPNVL